MSLGLLCLVIVAICAVLVAGHRMRERRQRPKRRAAFFRQFPRAEWRRNDPSDHHTGEEGDGDDA
jgi:hypothetical protein